jgi:hypothetical protein
MSSYHHRKTGGVSDDLTVEQRIEINQRNLSREVGNACQRWLDARWITSKKFSRHSPTRSAGDPSEAQETPPQKLQ